MFVEFFVEVLFIKIKVHGYIENITKKECETIDTFAIKNKNTISFKQSNIKYIVRITDDCVVLQRENPNFKHELIFKLNTSTISLYYIKEYQANIEIKLITKKLLIKENSLLIEYLVEDSNEEFKYLLEMSE